MIILDINTQLAPVDQDYFRTSREKRLGTVLEDVQRGRDKERTKFATFLKPYRRRLQEGAFLGGEKLVYADIALASSLCWAKATSAYDILDNDELMESWFARVLESCHQSHALKPT